MQEFRVESNNYPAEFGTGTGGQVSVVTKSGSNLFRGSVFEYYRNDKLDAPNYFDSTRNTDGSVIQELPKSKLNQHQFGGSFGGPLAKDRAFFFGSYEGYRLDAGVNFVEAAPSAAAWARAVPAIAALRPGFTAPGAVLLPGASTNADFDIYQLQGLEEVEENAFSVRLDYRINPQWNVLRPRVPRPGRADPSRRASAAASSRVDNKPTNAIFNLQGTFGSGLLNEFKVGYNAPHDEHQRRRADGRTASTSAPRHQPDRLDRQHRHRRPERVVGHRRSRRPGARQQRDQRPRPDLRPVLARVLRLGVGRRAATTSSSSAATSA